MSRRRASSGKRQIHGMDKGSRHHGTTASLPSRRRPSPCPIANSQAPSDTRQIQVASTCIRSPLRLKQASPGMQCRICSDETGTTASFVRTDCARNESASSSPPAPPGQATSARTGQEQRDGGEQQLFEHPSLLCNPRRWSGMLVNGSHLHPDSHATRRLANFARSRWSIAAVVRRAMDALRPSRNGALTSRAPRTGTKGCLIGAHSAQPARTGTGCFAMACHARWQLPQR